MQPVAERDDGRVLVFSDTVVVERRAAPEEGTEDYRWVVYECEPLPEGGVANVYTGVKTPTNIFVIRGEGTEDEARAMASGLVEQSYKEQGNG
jgi:hypothetical protein